MRTMAGYLYGGLAMKYTKPPLFIEQQIDLLKSRGMTIDNPARVARYLAYINYYRLRAYWLPFKLISPSASRPVRMRKLIEEYLPDKTASMGFPKEWRNYPLWRD